LNRLPLSIVDGVRYLPENPNPVSLVRSSDVGSAQSDPCRIIPERPKIGEDDVQSSTNERWRVFHEDESRSNIANNTSELPPESGTLSGQPESSSGNGDILAREAARNDVNNSSPWLCVKRANVIPDRERTKESVVLSLSQDRSGISISFNRANGLPSEEMPSENPSSSACEKSQLIQSLQILRHDTSR